MLQSLYPNVRSNSFLFEVSRETVSGHYCYQKFGANFDVAISSEETIWSGGGLYSYLSTASVIKLSSESANDAYPSGTGARTLHVYGVGADWKYIKEIVNLNGQTPVNTVNSFLRIFRMEVVATGSSGQNAGNLWAGTGTVTAGVPANKYAVINYNASLLINQTLMAIFTVPAGYTGFLDFLDTHIEGGKQGRVSVLIRRNLYNHPFQLKRIVPLKDTWDGRNYKHPIVLPEKTDIEFRGINQEAAQTLFFACTFDIVLAKNNNNVEDIDID